jgi:hypothetical protein
MAAEILGGEYAFVLATHVDRGHIHNHFVWGAANIVTHKRYRSNKSTYHEIRSISDRLCKDNSLSVIVPHGIGKSYAQYNVERNGTSWKAQLKAAIDNVLSESAGFEDFIRRMEALGYEVKRRNPISFRAPEQERFIRSKSLGDDYTEEAIRRKLSEKSKAAAEATPPVDLAGNPKHAKSRGLEQWARLQNLKNTVDAFNLMMEYGGLAAFGRLMIDCKTDIATVENGIKANSDQLTRLRILRDTIVVYNRTKPIYRQYRETKFFKERFRKKHEGEIIKHENAASDLQNYYTKPLPKLKELSAEIAKIEAANVNNNKWLTKKKTALKQMNIVHSYLSYLKREHEPPTPPPPVQVQTRAQKKSYDLSL